VNKDLFFDAMEYIDDDMLEDVNVLREKRKSPPNRMRMRYASAAACVCIVIGGMMIASRTGIYDDTKESDGTVLKDTSENQYIGKETGTSPDDNMSVNDGSAHETGDSSGETTAGNDGSAHETGDSSSETGKDFGETPPLSEEPFPDSLDFSGLDVSNVKSIRITCGYNGEAVLITDTEGIREITDLVQNIRCDSPESSRGYYGWSFGIYLYDEENPSDDASPLWYGSMFWGKMYSSYIYETVNGFSYRALYRMTGITTDEIDAVCWKYFPSLADFAPQP